MRLYVKPSSSPPTPHGSVDPSLAARYHRLMVNEGKHHNSALCHVSTVLLARIIACWRRGTPYLIRDVDGTPLMPEEARRIVPGQG